MAATGATPISLYYTTTASAAPTAGNLVAGELAINTLDGKLFYKDSAGVVQVIAGKGGAGVAGGSNTQVQYNSSGSLAGSANMTFNGTTFTTANDASISGLTVGKGNGSGSENTAVGYLTLSATSGNSNSAYGWSSLRSNTTGTQNAGYGGGSLYSNTTGGNNTAVGLNSLVTNTTGGSNVAVGTFALNANTTASNNTAVGYQALYSQTTGNTYNVALGYQAGYSSTSTSGSNCFIGGLAGYTSTGAGNTFLGYGAGFSVTTGAKNSIIGAYSGNQGGLDIRTANNNIVLSDGDGNPRLYSDSNGFWNMNGGTNANSCSLVVYRSGGDSNMQVGTTQNNSDVHIYLINSTRTCMVGSLGGALTLQTGSNGVYLANGATSWSAYSDERLKNITGTYTNALADVAKLEPVKFTWKSDSDKKPCVGLIAQSVEKVVPEAVDKIKKIDYKETGDDTEYLSLRYSELVPLLVAAIQELKAEVDSLKQQLNGA
jgi:hypothetical protein